MNNKKEVNKMTWIDFQESGLLWFINTILHMFGWAICVNPENNTAFPAKVIFRGFTEKDNTEGYKKVTQHIAFNIQQLLEDSEDE